jgi:site-specific DNA recombinase
MSTNGKDKSGRIRVRCSAATESGTCPSPKTFYLASIEKAVLASLRSEMRHPSVIAEYVKAYHQERKRLFADARARRSRVERRLGELTREIDRLVDAIAKGLGDAAVLGPRSTDLNEERKRLLLELETVGEAPDGVVALRPAILARYEQQLADLQDCLASSVASGDPQAAKAIRDLVQTVTVSRDGSKVGGVAVEITGQLNALLGDQAFPNGHKGVWGSMVAVEGLLVSQ